MMKKILRAKRGEGYVDMCVGVVVFVMILVKELHGINVFRTVDATVHFCSYRLRYGGRNVFHLKAVFRSGNALVDVYARRCSLYRLRLCNL